MECERFFPIQIFVAKLFGSLMTDQVSETLSVFGMYVCVNSCKYGGF